MKINSINNYQNQTFKGYENVKLVGKQFVRAKEGEEGALKLFIAGGEKIDKKVAEANKNIQKRLDKTSSMKESRPNSVSLYFAGLLSALGFKINK